MFELNEGFWFLGSVGMFSPGIDKKFLVHGVAEFVFREHALHADLNKALWAAGPDFGDSELFQTPRIPGVVLIFFHVFLIAGKAHFVRINDDDEITGIHMRGIFRVMFSPEDRCDPGAEATEDFSVRIDNKPTAVDFLFLDGPGLVT